MVLVAHNYDAYKVENRDKEREETARKAAKMADEVLIREPDRESHPVTLLPTITLLSESRFVTPEELDSLIIYLTDKRERLMRGRADPHAAAGLPPSVPAHPRPCPPLLTQSMHLLIVFTQPTYPPIAITRFTWTLQLTPHPTLTTSRNCRRRFSAYLTVVLGQQPPPPAPQCPLRPKPTAPPWVSSSRLLPHLPPSPPSPPWELAPPCVQPGLLQPGPFRATAPL